MIYITFVLLLVLAYKVNENSNLKDDNQSLKDIIQEIDTESNYNIY